jgi:hypothetical protein
VIFKTCPKEKLLQKKKKEIKKERLLLIETSVIHFGIMPAQHQQNVF